MKIGRGPSQYELLAVKLLKASNERVAKRVKILFDCMDSQAGTLEQRELACAQFMPNRDHINNTPPKITSPAPVITPFKLAPELLYLLNSQIGMISG